MAEDYFDQEDGAKGMSEGMDKGKGEEESHEGKSAVINSEICPGLEPGDTLTLRVTGVHDAEYEVEYMDGEDEGKEKGEDSMAEEHEGGGGGESEYASMFEG